MVMESRRLVSFSPEGRSLAVARGDSGEVNIWISDLEANQPRQLTLDGGYYPIWSLDGLRMAYLKPGTGLVEQTLGSNEPSMFIRSQLLWPVGVNYLGRLNYERI